MLGSHKENEKPVEDPFQDRRSDYDVTNTVKVSSTTTVRRGGLFNIRGSVSKRKR